MTIPFEPLIFGWEINIHLILEYAAFFVAFRYYLYLKKKQGDRIVSGNRLSIILGAALGALIGSRLFGWLENPLLLGEMSIYELLNTKTIMGGLFGGLLGVELTKKMIGENQSSGDLFVFPIILGVIIGRIGCFLYGINEFTYGKETGFIFGMDLGDGLHRHPIALYEIVFLLLIFAVLQKIKRAKERENGLLFQYFMIAYFSFRFGIEFLKPNTFFIFGLSSIQYLCLICLAYYRKTLTKLIAHAQ